MSDYWAKISERFDEWTPPLRPTCEDVEMFRNFLDPCSKTLLLGVTSELRSLATVAVDNNPQAIQAYPSSAVFGDWSDLPFGPEFDAVIGDGSLNVFQGTPELFFQQAQKVLKKNGRLILRVYISPEIKEDLTNVLEEKEEMGFHAFKWRVAQVLANPYVRVKDLFQVVKPVYDHPTLDLYLGSNISYYFPKISDLPPWTKIQFGSSYELADRCPVIMWNFNS